MYHIHFTFPIPVNQRLFTPRSFCRCLPFLAPRPRPAEYRIWARVARTMKKTINVENWRSHNRKVMKFGWILLDFWCLTQEIMGLNLSQWKTEIWWQLFFFSWWKLFLDSWTCWMWTSAPRIGWNGIWPEGTGLVVASSNFPCPK